MARPRKNDTGLPPCVYMRRGSYFLVKKGKWTRIPDPSATEALVLDLRRRYAACKCSAKRRGLAFSITEAYIMAEVARHKWRCAVSGAPFSLSGFGKTGRRPLAPSIDRIDSRKGYIPGNVRVVCLTVNMAMNDWGEAAVLYVVRFWTNALNWTDTPSESTA